MSVIESVAENVREHAIPLAIRNARDMGDEAWRRGDTRHALEAWQTGNAPAEVIAEIANRLREAELLMHQWHREIQAIKNELSDGPLDATLNVKCRNGRDTRYPYQHGDCCELHGKGYDTGQRRYRQLAELLDFSTFVLHDKYVKVVHPWTKATKVSGEADDYLAPRMDSIGNIRGAAVAATKLANRLANRQGKSISDAESPQGAGEDAVSTKR